MKQIHYKNSKIAYSEAGKGTHVVLLHGFLENQLMWQNFVSELSKKHHVITIDLLGHGQTECLGYIHTMEDNADVVYEVLQTLHIKKAVFIGHSMGGYVALAFAELYPNRINGLVLLNSTAYEDSKERKKNRDRAIKAVKKDYTTFVKLSIANLFSEDSRERLENEIENVKSEALKTPLQGIIASLEGMKVRKDRAIIIHVAMFPILFVLGKKDPVLNYEETITQIEGTNAKLISFPDGHMSYIENREELEKVLLDFLREFIIY